MSKYFLSFVEEFWPGQIEGTWIGRMEYRETNDNGLYNSEIGISTHDCLTIEQLRINYDFKTVSRKRFQKICKEIELLNVSGRKGKRHET